MKPEELLAWKALCEAATPGPWFQILSPWGNGEWVNSRSEDPHGGAIVCDCQAQEDSDDDNQNAFADAAFIAEARTALPACIAEIERLRALFDKADIAKALELADAMASTSADDPYDQDLAARTKRLAHAARAVLGAVS